MDFIEGLPKSNGFTTILVVVDKLSKFGYFVPLKHPYSAATVAKAFLDNIIKFYGMPYKIISDRDPIFLSSFWKQLLSLIIHSCLIPLPIILEVMDKLKF